MIEHYKKKVSRCKASEGRGIADSIINRLPIELHLPGYQYCGPGTKLQKRLERGDPGINSLDKACKEHDISYSIYKNIEDRHRADQILADRAWQISKSRDSKAGERASAWFVTNAMKAKLKLGMGAKLNRKITKKARGVGATLKRNMTKVKKNAVSFRKAVQHASQVLKNDPTDNMKGAIKKALKAAKTIIKRKNTIKIPRIIPVPKTGGVLPFLIPLFAGLSAVGALSGGAAGIAKAVIGANNAKKQLSESERHNREMEMILVGKGLHLKPYRKGLGLYLNPQSKNF